MRKVLAQSIVFFAIALWPYSSANAQKGVIDAIDGAMLSEVERLVTSGIREQQIFEKLDAAAEEIRSGRARFETGEWKQTSFYAAIGVSLDIRLKPGFVSRWTELYPQSPTPKILLAQSKVYSTMGAAKEALLMGGSSQEWQPDPQDVENARQYLLSIRELSGRDPYWYVLMARVALMRERSDAEFTELMLGGIRAFAECDELYAAASDYFLPKWGGSAAALETWARRVSEETKGNAGAFAYAYTHLHAMKVHYGSMIFRNSRASWADIKKDSERLLKAYPSDKNAALFTMVACLAGDHSETSRLLRSNPSGRFLRYWMSGEDQAACQSWAETPAWKIWLEKHAGKLSQFFERVSDFIDFIEAAMQRLFIAMMERITRRS